METAVVFVVVYLTAKVLRLSIITGIEKKAMNTAAGALEYLKATLFEVGEEPTSLERASSEEWGMPEVDYHIKPKLL